LKLEILDLRREVWRTERGVIVERRKLPEDPRGYTLVDLASAVFSTARRVSSTARITTQNSPPPIIPRAKHEYLLSRSVMDADVIINLPKLKTHKKVGLTVSLKNLVGINGDKNYLPHFCIGTPDKGGDEFPDNKAGDKISKPRDQCLQGHRETHRLRVETLGPSGQARRLKGVGDSTSRRAQRPTGMATTRLGAWCWI